jgi:hypothetical protein
MKTRKVVINACYGGFSLSEKAAKLYKQKLVDAGLPVPEYSWYWKRDDPLLVEIVETLGEEANGRAAELRIVEIPADVKWQIDEYGGNEWVAEKHRTWGAEE